jgi:ribonucleoside-diphosphate reductase alpha chain
MYNILLREWKSLRHIELNNELTIKKDGFFDLAKDKEALLCFLKEVEDKKIQFSSLKERLNYMIQENYYYNVEMAYSFDEIEKLYELVYNAGFTFQSYMAETNDGKHYLEGYEDRIAIVALYLGRGNIEKALKLAKMMIQQNYQPATPTFLNAGRSRRGELVSCFLLEMDDSLNSIGFQINTAMQLSKIGGGVALNLSKLRARGEQIKEIDNAASGVVPVMKLLEDSFSYANQLGQRKGAGATYLNIFHWDVVEFLDTKKINADEKSRIQSLSIGLIVPNKFFELAEKNEPFYVFAPYTVYKEYGIHLDDFDIDERYEELLNNERVKKKKLDLNARDLLVKIAAIQLESGYPYLMYKSNANQQHALKDIGEIKMSNLC